MVYELRCAAVHLHGSKRVFMLYAPMFQLIVHSIRSSTMCNQIPPRSAYFSDGTEVG